MQTTLSERLRLLENFEDEPTPAAATASGHPAAAHAVHPATASGTNAATAAPFAGLYDEVAPPDLGMGAAREFLVEQWRRQGVENPEAQAQDGATVYRHMTNIQQLSAEITALGGVAPTIDDLRHESQFYAVVMRRYIKQLEQYPQTEAAKRGIPLPGAPRWVRARPTSVFGAEKIGEDVYRERQTPVLDTPFSIRHE